MQNILIRRLPAGDEAVAEFTRQVFTAQSEQNGLTQAYDTFCFAAEDDGGRIAGAVTGKVIFDEVHIENLVVAEWARGTGLGTALVRAAEDEYRIKGCTHISLTTFGYQAPDFYRKLGYEVEFVRRADDPRLDKYFFRKNL